ncbi:Zinc finger, RING/FYVE/PHD-type [Corchorus olitorius]|uniref:Zinc finger, RING/FYVE/PHD-type n=1 Tax=Corchorus olitorius TaxID=93759 RepID=A0A1R3G3R7_9ROSI|nr:Zinc finger, RING/FYVE/PHD-type [Corchorus olitorius]
MESDCNAVKNKESKVDFSGGAESSPFSAKRAVERNKSLHNSETKLREEETEDISIHDNDLESLMNSPIQSDQGHNDSREAHSGSSCSGSSSRSDCFSGSASEEEEDGCLDNWEDVADALSADDSQNNLATAMPTTYETKIESTCADQQFKNQVINRSNSESRATVCGSHMNCRAWRSDDAFRPRSLPSLPKEHNSSLNSDWHNSGGAITWAERSTMSHPSSCPICCEDLDMTDSSFLPCPCGFRLCLFCHKRILEADARCPGCRKQYDSINGKICFSR